jgi:hypothetical protein
MNFFGSKKMIVVFAVIGAIAVLAMVLAVVLRKDSAPPLTQEVNPVANFKKEEIPPSQFPRQFPTDLPIEEGAIVVENFATTFENGTFQATRSYKSKNSPATNYRTFTDFFRTGDWEILLTSDTAAKKIITAKRGQTTVQAMFYTSVDNAKDSIVKIDATIQSITN